MENSETLDQLVNELHALCPPGNERGDGVRHTLRDESTLLFQLFDELQDEQSEIKSWDYTPRNRRLYFLNTDINAGEKFRCRQINNPASVRSELTRFLKKVEERRKFIEGTEAICMDISYHHAKKNLDIFLDHLYYYLDYEADEYLCPEINSIFICCRGSVLSAAAAAIAQSLISGCVVMLIPYSDNLPTINHLCKVWEEVNPEGRLWCHQSNVKFLLAPQSSLKISIPREAMPLGKRMFLSPRQVPLLVLDGADLHSVLTVVMDEENLISTVDLWALSIILISESQLVLFKTMLIECLKAKADSTNIELIKQFAESPNSYDERYHLCKKTTINFNSKPLDCSHIGLSDAVFVVPVHSAEEAIEQANHYGGGYAAAVYTEDVTLSQWVSEKLKVSTVWVNCIGQRHPAAPQPFQVLTASESGHCTVNALHSSASVSDLLNFGMPLGWKTSEHSDEIEKWHLSDAVTNAVKAASNAQASWASIGGLEMNKALIKFYISGLERLKSSLDPLADDLEKCSTFFEGPNTASASCHAKQDSGFAITTQLLPIGIVAVYVHNNETPAINVIKVIQGAIAYGNTCVVLLADDTNPAVEILYGSGSSLPEGVVNIVRSKGTSNWYSLIYNMEINSLWSTAVTLEKEHESLKDHFAKGTLRIWTGINKYLLNIGKSSTVSLKTFAPFATVNKYVWRKKESTSSNS